jgi:hypothetical protein
MQDMGKVEYDEAVRRFECNTSMVVGGRLKGLDPMEVGRG